MKRPIRLALSLATSLGLLGGVGVAISAMPVDHSATSANPKVKLVANPELAELLQLRAELAQTSGDGHILQLRIAALQDDFARAQVRRRQQQSTLATQSFGGQPLTSQLRALVLTRPPVPPRPPTTLAASRPAVATHSPAPSSTPTTSPKAPAAAASAAPTTHASTGASGATSIGSDGGEDD